MLQLKKYVNNSAVECDLASIKGKNKFYYTHQKLSKIYSFGLTSCFIIQKKIHSTIIT